MVQSNRLGLSNHLKMNVQSYKQLYVLILNPNNPATLLNMMVQVCWGTSLYLCTRSRARDYKCEHVNYNWWKLSQKILSLYIPTYPQQNLDLYIRTSGDGRALVARPGVSYVIAILGIRLSICRRHFASAPYPP